MSDTPTPTAPPPADGLFLPLPVLPLKNTVLFPYLFAPLAVGRPASRAAVEAALGTEDKTLVVVAQRDPDDDSPGPGGLYPVGTRAVIKRAARGPEGVEVLVQGIDRVRIESVEQAEPYLKAAVRVLPFPTDAGPEVEALERAVTEVARRVLELANPQAAGGFDQFVAQAQDPLHLAYLFASVLGTDLAKEQELLEADSREAALRLLHEWLAHEAQVLEIRNQIQSKTQTEISKEQRDFLLRRQLKAIREELGDEEGGNPEVEVLRKQFDEADLPDEVRKEASRELGKLEGMPPAAPDFQITRSYLELLLELPWKKSSPDALDLAHAREVLDADHFDLKEVKDRIVEHLAVLKLNPRANAPILCFVGPPGVGKTSLGQSIARAMGRTFERVSLGGMHDESELRGHRRTYIGAMPGRIIQAIRRAGVNNPVLMLDEVDKLGRDYRGDPAAALLEILDPAQNGTFRDNYLNLPFDLSKVFFITTANALDAIPGPLLDRMEILRLSGYSEEEKLEIARRYLIPRQRAQAGLKEADLTLPDETVRRVISGYTREAGVRRLEQMIGRLARKVAARFAEGKAEPVTVRPDDLPEMLGPERGAPEQARSVLPPGVATGLAWTEAGGEILYVEASRLPGPPRLRLTGQLGKVMRESARTAHSFVWAHADELGIDPQRCRGGVHVHVPAGAIPKDGPSAGVAMVTAFASLYSGVPARADTAMTGEITLTGLVMPIGGVKEKVLAARRAGIRRVIIPRQNERDLRELPEAVRSEMTFFPVETAAQVLAAAMREPLRSSVGVS
jgi:ATP-dependent Lon protease